MKAYERSLDGRRRTLCLDLEDADVQVGCDLAADAGAVAHQIEERQNLRSKTRLKDGIGDVSVNLSGRDLTREIHSTRYSSMKLLKY